MPTAGTTHDIVITDSDGTAMGFMVEPGSYADERADDFAPRIATGNDPTLREGIWDEWVITGAPEGIDQLTAANRSKILRSDGNVFLRRDQGIQLNAAWTSSDAAKTLTAPMLVDFGSTLVAAGVGTKVRRHDFGAGTWTDSTTTFATSVVWLHRHGIYMFAACGSGDAIQRTTDLITWTEPSAETADCLCTWQAPAGTVYLVLGRGTNIKTSSDNGANWSAAKAIGNADSNITGLAVHSGLLIIGKEDGLYTYDGVSVDEMVIFQNQKYSGNCKAIVSHEGFIYTHVLGRVWKLSFSGGGVSNKVDITPRMLANQAERLYGHGIPVWLWSGPEALFAVFDDGESVYPEVLSYNDLGWHQEYRGASGDTMRAGGYSRLAARTYVSDGATRYRKNTNLSDLPAPDDYAGTGEFITSDFDGGLPWMVKAYRHLRVEVEDCSGAGKIVFSYSKDKGATYTALADVTANGKQTLIFPTGQPVASEQLRWKVVITRVSATVTPVLRRMATSFLNRPTPVYVFSCRLRLANGQTLRNQTAETDTVDDKLAFLRACEASSLPVEFADVLGNEFNVYVTRIRRRMNPENLGNQGAPTENPEYLADVTMIKVDMVELYDEGAQYDAAAYA